MLPAFHRGAMEGYGRLMVGVAGATSDRWLGTSSVDLAAEMQGLTMTVAGRAFFGTDYDEADATAVRLAVAAIASENPLVSLLAPFRRTGRERDLLHAFVERLIDARIASGLGGDLLSLLLSVDGADAPEGRARVHDQVLTILVAGHDTIAHALAWTWIALARDPDIERALHRELDEVLNGRLPEARDAEHLSYTRAVFAESLRLFPPAAITTRLALEDCEFDGQPVRAGTIVVASQYLVHRDPRFFGDPLRFDPGRWLTPPSPPRPKLAYFPFGAGPRACIGEGFAWMEAVLLLAVLAGRWRVRPAHLDAIERETRVTLRPKPPLPARLERRR